MVMAKKIVFEIIADSDCTTLKTWNKVIFRKVCVCLSVYRIVSMANNNSRKFKQNQTMFCIQPWIVEFSTPIDFGKDRLRERGSLPATLYILTRVFSMANDNSRKFKQNQIIFCIQPWFVESSRPVVFGEDRLRGCLLYTSII